MTTLANRFRRQAELTLRDETQNPGNFKIQTVGSNTMTFCDADDGEISFVLKILDHRGNFELSTENIILEGKWLELMNDFCKEGTKAIQDVISLASKEYYHILMNTDDSGETIEEEYNEQNEMEADEECVIIDENENEKKELPIHQTIRAEVENWLKSFRWRRSQEQKAILRDQRLLEKQFQNVGKHLSSRPQLDMELIDINTDMRKIILALNKQVFEIRYPIDYNTSRGTHLSISSESQELQEVVSRLNNYLTKKAPSLYAPHVAISVLLTKLLEIYIDCRYIEPMTPHSKKVAKDAICDFSAQNDMVDEENLNDNTEYLYKQAWGSTESFVGPYSQEAKRVLMKQLQTAMNRNGIDGWEIELYEDNPFVWRVRLFDFPKDSALNSDLETYNAKYNLGKDIILEMKFTGECPNVPPSVRIVRPRLAYLSGNVTFGGTFCVDFLMSQNWNKYTYLDTLITQLRKSLLENGARVDLRTCIEYDEKVAYNAWIRTQQTNSKPFPTANGYYDRLLAFSSNFAKSTYRIPFNSQVLEKGNKVLLPVSVAEQIFQDKFELPLIFELKPKKSNRVYVGVSEFTAPESNIIMPQWLLKSLFLTEGQKIDVRCVSLSHGTFMKLQPHSKEFYEIEDHKAVLEDTLLHYSCVTEGQSIPVYYNNKQYLVEVVELKPERACSLIVEQGFLEISIDFMPALDLVDENTLKEMQAKQINYKRMLYKKRMEKQIKKAQKSRQQKKARVQRVLSEASHMDKSQLAHIKFKFPNGVSNHEIYLSPSTPTQILYEYVEVLEDPEIYVCKPYTEGIDLELSTQYQVGSSLTKFIIPNSFVDNLETAGLYPKGVILVSEHDKFAKYM